MHMEKEKSKITIKKSENGIQGTKIIIDNPEGEKVKIVYCNPTWSRTNAFELFELNDCGKKNDFQITRSFSVACYDGDIDYDIEEIYPCESCKRLREYWDKYEKKSDELEKEIKELKDIIVKIQKICVEQGFFDKLIEMLCKK